MAAEDATQSVPDGEVSRVFGSASVSLRVGDFLDFDQIYRRCQPLRSLTIPTGTNTSLQQEVFFRLQRLIFRPRATSTSLFVIRSKTSLGCRPPDPQAGNLVGGRGRRFCLLVPLESEQVASLFLKFWAHRIEQEAEYRELIDNDEFLFGR